MPQVWPPARSDARSSASASMCVRNSRQRALRSGRPPVAACRSATARGPRARSWNLLKSGTSNSYSQNGRHTVCGMSCTTPAPIARPVCGSVAAMKSASIGIAARSSAEIASRRGRAGSCSPARASIRRAARAKGLAVISAGPYGADRAGRKAATTTPARRLTVPPPANAGGRLREVPCVRGIDARPPKPDHRRMLSATLPSLSAGFVLPGDPSWDHARSGFNLTLDQHPAAVALPADARDVAAAVNYARAAGWRVAPQATGHNQGPLGDLEGTLLLNVARAAGGARRSRRAPRPGRRGCQVGARRRPPERLRARRPARVLARRRDRGLLARRRHRLALAQVRHAGQRGDRVRARHWPTAGSCARTPTTTRTCSGRCAAAAGTSAW